MNRILPWLLVVGLPLSALALELPHIAVSPDKTEATWNDQTFYVRDVPKEETTKRINDLNSTAEYLKQDVHITTCEPFIVIPTGAHGENRLYGAICTLEKNGAEEKAAICDSSMTNAFGVQPLNNQNWTKTDLITFVASHCSGG